MTVFVDDMFLRADVPNGARQVRGVWCHMFSDSLDPAELHEMAEKIDMRRSWFQHKSRAPWQDHYDVTKSKRALAVAAGAIEVTTRQMVEIDRVKRCLFLGVDPDEDRARRDRSAAETRARFGITAPVCEPATVEVDGREVTVLARKIRGAQLTAVDRKAIEDFARFLRTKAGQS